MLFVLLLFWNASKHFNFVYVNVIVFLDFDYVLNMCIWFRSVCVSICLCVCVCLCVCLCVCVCVYTLTAPVNRRIITGSPWFMTRNYMYIYLATNWPSDNHPTALAAPGACAEISGERGDEGGFRPRPAGGRGMANIFFEISTNFTGEGASSPPYTLS